MHREVLGSPVRDGERGFALRPEDNECMMPACEFGDGFEGRNWVSRVGRDN
jgi:hypothetical protein